jgi:hypothetical protein
MRRCRDGAPPTSLPANAIDPDRRIVTGVTSFYLQGIDPDQIIQTVHNRRPPMIPGSVGILPTRRT